MLQPRLAVLRHDVGVAVVGWAVLALVTVGVQCVWWWWWKWRRGSAGGGGGGGALRINEMNPCLNECHFISILD